MGRDPGRRDLHAPMMLGLWAALAHAEVLLRRLAYGTPRRKVDWNTAVR
jgi:hypothetical protein